MSLEASWGSTIYQPPCGAWLSTRERRVPVSRGGRVGVSWGGRGQRCHAERRVGVLIHTHAKYTTCRAQVNTGSSRKARAAAGLRVSAEVISFEASACSGPIYRRLETTSLLLRAPAPGPRVVRGILAPDSGVRLEAEERAILDPHIKTRPQLSAKAQLEYKQEIRL